MSRFDLLPFQRDAARHIIGNGGSGGLFLEMGCGKTRVALAVAAALRCRRLLIVAPLSVPSVWIDEARRVWPALSVTSACSGPVRARAARVSAYNASDEPFAVIVNYESYWRVPLRAELLRGGFDMVIYDEAHRLAHRSSKQARFAHSLAERIPHRLALTGTPMPNGPQDLFSVYRGVSPDVFGRRWPDFQARYLRMGGFQGYQITGYRNLNEIEDKLTRTAFRITKEEAVDLPERTDVEVRIDLDDRRRYDELRRRAITEVQSLQGQSGIVLARSALTNIIRLSQMTSGFGKTDDGAILDVSSEKLTALVDLMKDVLTNGNKHVVVFCRFTHDVDRTADALQGPARAVYILDGRVPSSERTNVLTAWRATGGALVCQIQVGSLGIDLTAANVAVFYSLDYSLVNYLQARDRLHRIGQVNKVTYYNLVVNRSVDEIIYTALRNKEDLTKSLLDYNRVLDVLGA